MIVVLSNPSQITDFMAYTLGLKDPELLDVIMDDIMSGKVVEEVSDTERWTYDDLMGVKMRLVDVSNLYKYNAEYNLWEDMSDDKAYMKEQIEAGEELKIVGIVCAKEGANATALSAGVAYTSDLTRHVIELASDSELVKQQLADEEIDVFSGSRFDEVKESELNFQNMISVDSEAISSAFGMDISTEGILGMLRGYLSEVMNSARVDTTPAENEFKDALKNMAVEMLQKFVDSNAGENGEAKLYLKDVEDVVDSYLKTKKAKSHIKPLTKKYSVPEEDFLEVYRPVLIGLLTTHVAQELAGRELTPPDSSAGTSDIESLPTEPAESEQESTAPTEPEEEATAPTEPEQETTEPTEPEEETTTPTEPEIPTDPSEPETGIDPEQFYGTISASEIEGIVEDYLNSAVVKGAASAMGVKMMEETIRGILMGKVQEFGGRLAAYIGNSFHVDGDKISNAFQFNMTEEELQRLMLAMSGKGGERSAKHNLRTLGYADLEQPASISIYLVDFAAKEEFIAFLDAYNEAMKEAEKEDQVIQYTDVTGMMMSSVRTIIDSVSYALIAFVAVSLVVSSIMIGIITYISVMERTKEIGILRAIGASKRNISQVFNAETFIIGLCSGLIGIGITLILLIPGNMLIQHLTENPDIVAQLPWQNAVILIILSVILTLIGGFIPAKKAAKKDPVIALRTE